MTASTAIIETSEDAAGRREINLVPLTVRLASPRGFCAGVERAVRAVEEALARYGAPIYVRHEIVHNQHVVRRLRAMGAIFVDELSQADAARPVMISAHGAAQSVFDEAAEQGVELIDATCPLVTKVHNRIRRFTAKGAHIFLIGHRGHAEVAGSLGQAQSDAMTVIETLEDVARAPAFNGPAAFVTQTTLSLDDTRDIVAALREKFPQIEGPAKSDICYATTNRQNAVRAIAPGVEAFFVIGSDQSSNSHRLVETALAYGARRAALVDDPATFDLDDLTDATRIGVSAGASAPEDLVEDFLARLASRRRLQIEHGDIASESVAFKPPTMR